MTAHALTLGAYAFRFDPLRKKLYAETRLGTDIAAFISWCELGGMSASTLLNYEADLARGALMFPDKGMADLTDDDMLHIARAFPQKSVRIRIAPWRTFFKWGKQSRRTTTNPTDALPNFKQKPQAVINVFNDAEIEALLSLPVRDAAPLCVLLEHGLRKAEARHLRIQHCLPENGQVIVLHGKGNRDRIVPMSPRLVQLVSELLLLERPDTTGHLFYGLKANQYGERKILRETPIGEGTFARWWRRCLFAAGVPYRNPHTARHTFADKWIKRGLGINDVQILMGHASISTTASIYVHTQIHDVAERMRAIETSDIS